MKNLTSLLLEIDKYLQPSLSNSSNTLDLFNGEAGEFIMNTYLNRSSDKEEYFEDLNDILKNATQLMEDIGYAEIFGSKLW